MEVGEVGEDRRSEQEDKIHGKIGGSFYTPRPVRLKEHAGSYTATSVSPQLNPLHKQLKYTLIRLNPN